MPRQSGLNVPGVQRLRQEVRLHLLVRQIVLVPAILLRARDAELAAPRDHHVLDVFQARVTLDNPGGAVRLLELDVDVRLGVLHEDRGLRVGFAHLLLPLLQTHEHVVRQDDRLVLALDVLAVFAREHVHLALVHAELADVRAEKEDVSALHDRIEDLRRR